MHIPFMVLHIHFYHTGLTVSNVSLGLKVNVKVILNMQFFFLFPRKYIYFFLGGCSLWYPCPDDNFIMNEHTKFRLGEWVALEEGQNPTDLGIVSQRSRSPLLNIECPCSDHKLRRNVTLRSILMCGLHYRGGTTLLMLGILLQRSRLPLLK